VPRLLDEGRCRDALAALGLAVPELRLSPHQVRGRTTFVTGDAEGVLYVRCWGRRAAIVRCWGRLWHRIAFRGPPDLLPVTLHGQVDAEASIERRAWEGGAGVPAVKLAGVTQGLAVLLEQTPPGRFLNTFAPTELTDAMIEASWLAVRALHRTGIAHGKLDAHHVMIAEGAAIILGFEAASAGASDRRVSQDVAELLAALAAIVGPDRAVAAATRVLGPDQVISGLPYVQPRALSGWTHDAFGGRRDLDEHLGELHAKAQESLDTEPVTPDQLYRVHPRTLLMAMGSLVAVSALLSRIGNPAELWATVRSADWAFVLLAFVLGLLRDIAYGVTFLGNVPIAIPVWPSIELQVAMAFSNLAVPVAADSAIQVRFLQRNGLDLPSAIATGGVLSSLTEIAVQLGMFLLALRLTPDTLNFGHIDATKLEWIAAGGILFAATIAAAVFSVQRLRMMVVPPVHRALRTVWHAIRSPRRLALLIGGNVVAQLLTTVSLLACLRAFGADVNFWTVLAIGVGVGLVASVVPIPGGGTAVSAIGLAGMLTAVGVDKATSAAAVLTYQIVHSYLPAVPGWVATRDLLRKGLL